MYCLFCLAHSTPKSASHSIAHNFQVFGAHCTWRASRAWFVLVNFFAHCVPTLLKKDTQLRLLLAYNNISEMPNLDLADSNPDLTYKEYYMETGFWKHHFISNHKRSVTDSHGPYPICCVFLCDDFFNVIVTI